VFRFIIGSGLGVSVIVLFLLFVFVCLFASLLLSAVTPFVSGFADAG